MKSNKQRRREIKERRLQRALAMIDVDPSVKGNPLPEGAVEADVELLAQHNNSYSLPLFYVDRPFVCRDCGSRVGCVRRAGTDLEPCAKACARRNAPFPPKASAKGALRPAR